MSVLHCCYSRSYCYCYCYCCRCYHSNCCCCHFAALLSVRLFFRLCPFYTSIVTAPFPAWLLLLLRTFHAVNVIAPLPVPSLFAAAAAAVVTVVIVTVVVSLSEPPLLTYAAAATCSR